MLCSIILYTIFNNKARMLLPITPCVDNKEVNSQEKCAV